MNFIPDGWCHTELRILSGNSHARSVCMRLNSLYGSALIISSLLLVAMGLTHPTGAGLLASRQAFQRFTLIDHVAHVLAIGGVWLSVVGLAGFSAMLGATRPSVVAAFIAFAMCSVAVLFGVTLDGFVVPQLADRWFDADQATRATLQQLMHFCISVASALTRIYMTLGTAAILIWSLAVWRARLSSGIPWLGLFVGIAAMAAIIGARPVVSVHELLILVLGWAAWMLWAGIVMLSAPEPSVGTIGGAPYVSCQGNSSGVGTDGV